MLRTPNEDIRSLKELVHYGLKGMAAYVEHAHNLGYESPEIFAFMQHALSELTRNDITVEELVQLTLETGKYGVSAMAQLDKANTSSYGNPEISQVSLGVRNNPGILISGHDWQETTETPGGSRKRNLKVSTVLSCSQVTVSFRHVQMPATRIVFTSQEPAAWTGHITSPNVKTENRKIFLH